MAGVWGWEANVIALLSMNDTRITGTSIIALTKTVPILRRSQIQVQGKNLATPPLPNRCGDAAEQHFTMWIAAVSGLPSPGTVHKYCTSTSTRTLRTRDV